MTTLSKKIDSINKITYSNTIDNLFRSLDSNGEGYIYKKQIIENLEIRGILRNDPRILQLISNLNKFSENQKINLNEFEKCIHSNTTIIEKALKSDLIIPDFTQFTSKISEIFSSVKSVKDGKVADYIPQLARVNPDYFAISICTVDGQQFHLGDHNVPYSVQSTSKPINYAIALEEFGEEKVHKHVGREPSGKGFNELTLNFNGLPHNPMINAGAIMSCSLIQPNLNISDRFEYVLNIWKKLAGNSQISFNNSIYLSEKQTADRNFALAYFMRENNAFPADANMLEILDFYFQACSIELNSASHSIVAGTLANAGVCPITRERIFSPQTCKNVLSLMYSCGMYDFSGEFAFSIGLPAKSGVSGSLLLVVPGVCGITIWSPPLDRYGNSVKAVEVSKKLVDVFNFHNYDNLIPNLDKVNPRLQKNEDKINGIMAANFAASQGDLNEIKNLKAKGIDLNSTDYDGRTPLHIACSEGHEHIVQYYIKENLSLNSIDRWGGKPIDDAKTNGFKNIENLLKKYQKTKGE